MTAPRARRATARAGSTPTPTRLLSAPEDFRAQVERAARRGDPLELPDAPIVCYPPTTTRAHWRLVYRADKRRETTCPDDVDVLYTRLTDLRTRCAALVLANGRRPVADMVDAWIEQQAAIKWKPRTADDRRRDMNGLLSATTDVVCADLRVEHLQTALAYCGTAKRAAFVRKRIAALLRWAASDDWISEPQARLIDKALWKAPPGYTEPRSRRHAARRAGTRADEVDRGEVPTHDQVNDWATATAVHYRHGDGMIQLAAVTGLRLGELLALTADPAVADAGGGNLVDLTTNELRIRVEVDDRARATDLPKADKIRDVVIPRTDSIPTGFDIRDWLQRRSEQALEEQATGSNPKALIFPSARGSWWSQSNLTGRVIRPACRDLDWPETEVTDANGTTRRWQRFTMHSLRDRYACTAVDVWGYTAAELFEQGAWQDMVTIKRYYYGTTDDTHAAVRDRIA